MVSSALVSTDGGPILRSSGVLPSNLSHSVDRGTLKAFEAAFLDMRPSRTSFSADSILCGEYFKYCLAITISLTAGCPFRTS